ncbi:nicotinamide riboside transporter PnuC [Rufibacter glacialis]|uniref:Nicotinamide riboside transporter PnuC n=1 Tax=Rufibacter glacialis TaxID=1259555 RepID=A0A5M8QQV4_9BACT|nr:nicotinamide riboside transporter PnuC [Rufibacter glacialis]KAA6437384.1 nicotinamide mononucleotide transporter [Rufibacter glacialis]GGK59710.1 putative nicotinamide mononucleotide transporter [Rufibacter glacialis]
MDFLSPSQWDLDTITEVVGVVTGLLCVWLAARQNIWTFPTALISVTLYIVIFYEARLYADMGLQVMFAGLNFYGWYLWLYKGNQREERPVTRTTRRQWAYLLVFVPLFTVGLGTFLHQNTDADLAFWDAGTTAVSLGAQWLMSRKKLENWLIWIVVDAVYVPIYLYKELYPTAGLYFLYLGLAWWGYLDWKKSMANPSQEIAV